MKKDDLIELMLKEKGEVSNTIDLNAYGSGLIDMYEHIFGKADTSTTSEPKQANKFFYFLGMRIEPFRNYTEDEKIMGIHLPYNSSDIHSYSTRDTIPKWDIEKFYDALNAAGCTKKDIYKKEGGQLVIPGGNELFNYNPDDLYNDKFYAKQLKELKIIQRKKRNKK